ncbi:hypothetical protein HI914_01051 [Erysiphe necator]|nr:hypothetical protein HI914_01051 [Erysiphe necator]
MISVIAAMKLRSAAESVEWKVVRKKYAKKIPKGKHSGTSKERRGGKGHDYISLLPKGPQNEKHSSTGIKQFNKYDASVYEAIDTPQTVKARLQKRTKNTQNSVSRPKREVARTVMQQ